MRRGLLLVAALAIGVLPLASSCAKFSGEDGAPADASPTDTTPTDDGVAPVLDGAGPESGALDGAVEASPVDGSPVGVSLLSDGFENGCAGWGGDVAVRSMTPPNTGLLACEACAGASAGVFTQTIDLNPAQTGDVRLQAFARVTNPAASPISVKAIFVCRDAAMERVTSDKVATLSVTGQYAAFENSTAFTTTAAKTVQIMFELPPSTCVLFDDISVTLRPK